MSRWFLQGPKVKTEIREEREMIGRYKRWLMPVIGLTVLCLVRWFSNRYFNGKKGQRGKETGITETIHLCMGFDCSFKEHISTSKCVLHGFSCQKLYQAPQNNPN